MFALSFQHKDFVNIHKQGIEKPLLCMTKLTVKYFNFLNNKNSDVFQLYRQYCHQSL